MNKNVDEKIFIETEKLYDTLTKTCIEKQLTITTMESATSGQIASLITDTEGSSAVFKGAYVAYSNEMKIKLGVPSEIIDTYSVYSKETAIEMAKLCRKDFWTDIGVGVTGTMGNVDPANAFASNPGKVYFAIDFAGKVEAFQMDIPAQASRICYKYVVANKIGSLLLQRVNAI